LIKSEFSEISASNRIVVNPASRYLFTSSLFASSSRSTFCIFNGLDTRQRLT